MLKAIRCDAFVDDLQKLEIKPGLNIIQGSSQGSNAIGKSTFLWILDFAFGGQKYAKIAQDVKKHVTGDLTVYVTFEFNGKQHYYLRKPEDPQKVYECTPDWRTIIGDLTVDQYLSELRSDYCIDRPGVTIPGIMDHFFRIYGRENTFEWRPMKAKDESHAESEDFLLTLFDYGRLLADISNMEQVLNIKAYEAFLKKPDLSADYEARIDENRAGIAAMKERLDKLLRKNGGDIDFVDLGIDTRTIETVSKLQKELRQISRQYESIRSQKNAVENNLSDIMTERAEEFEALKRFFPEANMKAFEDIESFHRQLRNILRDEMKAEIARLEPLLSFYTEEIKRLEAKIRESGISHSISEQIMSQCVSARQRLEELQAEREQLEHDKELYEERQSKMQRLRDLADKHRSAITSVEETVSKYAETINAAVTAGKEKAPVLNLGSKDLPFGTEDNTSEGTAFKNLVIYDLCIANLCPVPVLIHDSNIMRKIDDAYLEPLLLQYQETGKQVFVVLDKVSNASSGVQSILDKTTLMYLHDGHELFGHSWSKITPQTTDKTEQESEGNDNDQ